MRSPRSTRCLSLPSGLRGQATSDLADYREKIPHKLGKKSYKKSGSRCACATRRFNDLVALGSCLTNSMPHRLWEKILPTQGKNPCVKREHGIRSAGGSDGEKCVWNNRPRRSNVGLGRSGRRATNPTHDAHGAAAKRNDDNPNACAECRRANAGTGCIPASSGRSHSEAGKNAGGRTPEDGGQEDTGYASPSRDRRSSRSGHGASTRHGRDR